VSGARSGCSGFGGSRGGGMGHRRRRWRSTCLGRARRVGRDSPCIEIPLRRRKAGTMYITSVLCLINIRKQGPTIQAQEPPRVSPCYYLQSGSPRLHTQDKNFATRSGLTLAHHSRPQLLESQTTYSPSYLLSLVEPACANAFISDFRGNALGAVVSWVLYFFLFVRVT
jgi:hypothetical protein